MNPLGEMIDHAIDRRGGESGLRRAMLGLSIARACGLLVPFAGASAKTLRIVDPMTGLA